jgi:hypothetical protein
MRLSTILFFLFSMNICNYVIPPYTSPCKDAMKKYRWIQDSEDDQYAYFLDDKIRSRCHINYNPKMDYFYVEDDTKIKRVNQYFFRITISSFVTIFFMMINLI